MMKKILLIVSFLCVNYVYAQSSGYEYKGQMTFAMADSLFSPYLCTVDSAGNLWVASTNVASATAIHGLFMAAPGDASLHRVVAFTAADSVRDITGITTIGTDVFVSTRMVAPAGYSAPVYYPYSQIIYLPAGDPAKRVYFKQSAYKDYGTWYTSLDASKDKRLYFGQSYLSTIGTIDGNKASSAFGNTITFARIDWSRSMEPGGDMTSPNAVDLIRDVALDKRGNYADTTTVVYTSRNSSTDAGGEKKGGIAKWTGGKSADPAGYHAERITDIAGFLTIGTTVPNGIAVHPANGCLFVCGTEETKKWVKGFQVVGNFAIQMDELPSSTSKDVKSAAGAPFIAPGDVAFNSDATVAYVTDEGAKKVFKFATTTTRVNAENASAVRSFELQQNYPNPFNPTTNIVVTTPSASHMRASVFNMYGQEIALLADRIVGEGTHVLQFDGSRCSSGVYVCTVNAGVYSKSIKMVLMK